MPLAAEDSEKLFYLISTAQDEHLLDKIPVVRLRHLGSGISRKRKKHALPLFEIALVFVRFDHVASIIVNANHRIM